MTGRGTAIRVLLALMLWFAATGCAAPVPSGRDGTVMLHVLPEAGARPLLRALEGARRSIDMEMYLLSHRPTIDALAAARARGVRVRTLLEQRPFGGSNAATFVELERIGVEARWTAPTFRFTHAKTIVVDRAAAWVMSANLTQAAFRANREYLAVLTAPEAVVGMADLFEADWQRTEAPPLPMPLLASPTTARERLAALVEGATRTLDVEAEELVDRATIDQLAFAAGRGVTVRLVMSPSSDPLDQNEPGRRALVAAGGAVRLLQSPFIHAKMVLADDERLYVGSVNFSSASLDRDREVGVVLTAAPALELARRTFDTDWANARP